MSRNQKSVTDSTKKGKIIIRHPRKKKLKDVLTPVLNSNGVLITGQEFIPESQYGEYPVVVTKETQFQLINPTTIDLSDRSMEIHWGWLQHHPWIAKTKEEGLAKDCWYIDNPQQEAKSFVSNKMKVYELVGKINELSLADKSLLVRMMGVRDYEHWTQDQITQHLIEHAESDDSKSDNDYTKISKLLADEGMFKTLSFIYKAVDKPNESGVSESHGNYFADKTMVGSLDDMVSWVKSSDNKERVLVIKQKLGV